MEHKKVKTKLKKNKMIRTRQNKIKYTYSAVYDHNIRDPSYLVFGHWPIIRVGGTRTFDPR